MDFLPIFVATKNRKVVVVGDGQMADAKCRGVLKTAASVTVYTDSPSDEALAWAEQGRIALRCGLPIASDFESVTLFYAAHESDGSRKARCCAEQYKTRNSARIVDGVLDAHWATFRYPHQNKLLCS